MSDDTKSADNTVGEWIMPEPVYRTTPGHTPNSVHETMPADDIATEPGFHDAPTVETEGLQSREAAEITADDIPTEPGFHDAPTVETEVLQPREAVEIPAGKPVKVAATPPKPKKRGCARSFLTVVSLIVLTVIGVVIALIYFLLYYKAADTVTF